MARGKQAALSASRRHEAAMDHIRQLTDELTTMKMRARDAEARATSAELRVQRADLEIAQQKADVDRCVAYVDEHLRHVKASRKEWNEGPKDELIKMMVDALPIKVHTIADYYEFLWRRYPHLMEWLGWINLEGDTQQPNIYRTRFMAGLNEEALRSLQRVRRERGLAVWDETRDLAEIMDDMLDIGELRLPQDEVAEYMKEFVGFNPMTEFVSPHPARKEAT